MSWILCIDTTTENCSVALTKNGTLFAEKEQKEGQQHAGLLTLLIEQILKESSINMSDLSAIAVSDGPGSYTGLRIGASTAKGLCYALDIPLIAVDTLKAMAFEGVRNYCKIYDDFYCVPMMDARRMEVYTAVYDMELQEIEDKYAKVIDSSSFGTYLSEKKVLFLGNCSGKCADILTHPNALFFTDIYFSAINMKTIAYQKFINHLFEDIAYYEPYYLKKYLPKHKTKKIFKRL
ncbi:MAG: tRNA (adenosine(37)-N6)-threonylcarbamoyltransferase complex dimerization subunit type 1 TsaB [Chitinophagales bacterium]